MSKKTTVPPRLEHWLASPDRVKILHGLLETPTLQEAIALLKELAGPSVTSLSPDPQVNNQRLAWYAGYRDAFNDLEKLSRPKPSPQTSTTLDEWTHLQSR